MTFSGNWRCALFCAGTGLLWLFFIQGLMVADVWDETNALLLTASEPLASASIPEVIRILWLQEVPVDIYRPLASSLVIAGGKLFDGNFIVLRYFNALLLIGSAFLLTLTLLQKPGVSLARALSFFILLLFSSSAIMVAGWFANIFDATCFFFISLSMALFQFRRFVTGSVALVLAVFCKEIYVLSLPLFAILFFSDSSGFALAGRERHKAMLWFGATFVVSSAVYWTLRQNMIPLGSEGDVHSFAPGRYFDSLLSFAGGLLPQFSKFERGSPVLWLGVIALPAVLYSLRDRVVILGMAAMLLLASIAYWGMFDFQGDRLMTSHNFVARLYLIPFVFLLYFVCLRSSVTVIAVVAVISVWGMGYTYRDHVAFQQTYAEIYERAEQSDAPLVLHYPEKPLEDFRRELSIGDYPEAALAIDVMDGGLRNAL